MAFSEFEVKLHERTVQAFIDRRRPPPEIRDEVDLCFRIEGQSVVIFELRPVWRRPGETSERGIAKATYVKMRGAWKVYWMRADLRWHGYEPDAEVESLEEFLRLVDEDQYCAFFG